ncbi:MAG: DUF4886 domain-containing protein [Clostridia bacterium]|nr:DUF4886 domain-containing protein [Clostridia bacterium]
MKILSIGNSFSEDAQRWLNALAKMHGADIHCANLYIGGCSLETHWLNNRENNAFYDYQVNGNPAEEKISIAEALKRDNWDIVTLQQVSNFSGMPETYEPYLSDLIDTVKEALPDAEIMLHETWAYETYSGHPGFLNYNCSQKEMHGRIQATVKAFAEKYNLRTIPTGDFIQKLRETANVFNYPDGGISLCRDGYHLTYDYGRFAASALWFVTLTGKKISSADFADLDSKLLKIIIDTANSVL